MAPKRKPPQKTKLEDLTDSTPVTKKSKAGQLDKTVIEKQDKSREELFKQRQAKKSGTEAPAAEQKPADAQPESKASTEEKGDSQSSEAGIWVNRAPVLTLWVAVVAQRQGFSRDAGLTFGKAISGMLAQSKGKSIGVISEKEKDEADQQDKADKEQEAGVESVDVFGMNIKGLKSGDQVFAIDKGTTAVKPGTVQSYLSRAFGPRLGDAEQGLTHLAEGFSAEEIGGEAYKLYERFRPSVPQGQQGWGRKGLLKVDRLKDLRP